MADPRKQINISVEYDGATRHLTTYPNEYRNLMLLIDDQLFMDGFGECRGMGKCATCTIEILSSRHGLTGFDRNEPAAFRRAGLEQGSTRLSCQLLVDERLDGAEIKVLL